MQRSVPFWGPWRHNAVIKKPLEAAVVICIWSYFAVDSWFWYQWYNIEKKAICLLQNNGAVAISRPITVAGSVFMFIGLVYLFFLWPASGCVCVNGGFHGKTRGCVWTCLRAKWSKLSQKVFLGWSDSAKLPILIPPSMVRSEKRSK